MVFVQVEDNGVGIEQDDLTAIFGRGVSSKGIERGVGLHWCANTMARMHGQLSASSAGTGQGATFELRLPVALETV
jgi:sensor histidine kinase regulating citrate/malate metabolism